MVSRDRHSGWVRKEQNERAGGVNEVAQVRCYTRQNIRVKFTHAVYT